MWWLSDVKLISGACCASFAIACCRVEMVSDLEMSGIVPLRRPAIRRPLPSTGSRGSVPRLHRYYGAFRLPAAHPAALRCLRLAVPLFALALRSRRWPSAATAGQGLRVNRLPLVPVTARRRQALPGSWGTPLCSCPALRPRWDLHARPSQRFGAAFRSYYTVGSHNYHFRGSIPRPVPPLSTLPHPRPPRQPTTPLPPPP